MVLPRLGGPCFPFQCKGTALEDPADLAATDLDAHPSGRGGQPVERPLRRPGLIRRGKLAAGLHGQPTWGRLFDQAEES